MRPPELPAGPWRDAAERLPPTTLALPPPSELRALLEQLGVEPADVEELPALLAEVLAEPGLRWLAERYASTLIRDLGALGLPTLHQDPTRDWPVLPLTDGPATRCVYLPAFLATVPLTRGLHRQRGIPEHTSRLTLADFGRQLAVHRRTFGVAGTDMQWWLALNWSGALVDVGRLQGEWRSPRLVGLHIPESGPMSPEAVDESLDRVRAHWSTWFGATPTEAECVSWLLDPQLVDYLPASSNILAFQRRFTLDVENPDPADDSVLYFVFRRRGVHGPQGLADLPRDSAVQRAVADHLAAGGHWYFRRGTCPL
jgi:hypothetical protein